MHFLAALAAVAVATVRADISDLGTPDHSLLDSAAPDVEVVDFNKEYVVKLDCIGCPYARQVADNKAVWEQPPRKNALVLYFKVDNEHHDEPTLVLNGRAIQPLEQMPPNIQAFQVPADITQDNMDKLWREDSEYGVQMPLQYEHTVLRTQENGELTVQFDVTGLPLDAMSDPRFYPSFVGEPYKMDGEQQKLVQLRLHRSQDTGELLIEDVSIVARENRTQPYRMKCGRLAMTQTTYDPREWDAYGKFGTFERTWNVFVSQFVMNFAGLPAIILGTFCIFIARFCYQRRNQEAEPKEDDAEIALLGAESGDAPPAYADIPVIKIEEYD
ncbi:hypothetical protein HBI71_024940 [Parastagonospora nodorum]|nr:hypothetical protein HBI71_024940 [Parastagonospora nodorum]